MKKIIFVLIGISAIIVSLSIAYYFVIFLPKKENTYIEELKKIRREIQNSQNNQSATDISGIESSLEDLQNSIQEQKRDSQMQNDCESGGGYYAGNGTCVYR